ncbi:hypothetical protein SAMN05421847_2870 [Halpernia humi]|uniref:Uncharacterized protein n=1 Tax=Halpernia humi TaxID=493375 RepID=A0A1H6BGB1_9FLAO|nr:hypothetical protein SAMN05421847_2870 [Halpernia humi]
MILMGKQYVYFVTVRKYATLGFLRLKVGRLCAAEEHLSFKNAIS